MPKPSFDPRSAAVVLRYLGDASGEPHLPGVPARDLSANDVARLAWLGSAERSAVTDAQYAAMTDTLLTSGLYTAEAAPTD